jgi:hypothetical protein
MSSSRDWLRTLVVAQWLFASGGGIADAAGGRLPIAGLWMCGPGLLIGSTVAIALHALGSAGILARSRAAYVPYTAGALGLLLVLPFTGQWTGQGAARPLYELASLACGGVLALLWLAPSESAAGEAPAPRVQAGSAGTAILTAAYFVLGALALVGLLALAAGSLVWSMAEDAERGEAEARRLGAATDDAGCLAAARERAASEGWAGPGFLETCLESGRKTEAFCRDVPPLEPEAGWEDSAWVNARCEDDPLEACESLLYTVQAHCDERS